MFKPTKKATTYCGPVILKNEWTVGECIYWRKLRFNLDLQLLKIIGFDDGLRMDPKLQTHSELAKAGLEFNYLA